MEIPILVGWETYIEIASLASSQYKDHRSRYGDFHCIDNTDVIV